MKLSICVMLTTLWAVGCHSKLLPSAYVVRPLDSPVHPSYRVDGNLHFLYDDLLSHMFDYKVDSRDRFYVTENHRNKRATSFSYTTPDSTRSEQFSTYVDPRVRDGHPLNRYQGHVSWTSPEGIPFSLDYTADGGGFQPQAHHLPDSPYHRSFFTIGLS